MSPIEIKCINDWSNARGRAQEGRVDFDGVTFQVKPGESSFITSPDKVELFVECNQEDDGGEVTCIVFNRPISRGRNGINISSAREALTYQLPADCTEFVSVDMKVVAEIQHVPSKRKRGWLGRKQ